VLTQALLVYETLKVSVPTVAESYSGGCQPEVINRRLKSWGEACVRHAALDVTFDNAGSVDWSRTYVIMSNHQSYLDIPVLAVAVEGRVRFIAKKELFKVPVWGHAMTAAGIISIDRQNRERAIASLRIAAETLRSGLNIWIAPEGTRSRTGALGPLKKGGFLLAMETGAEILPMVVSGTLAAWPKDSLQIERGKKVHVTFGSPIPVARRTRDELMREVEGFLRAHLP
jgi:1-acyl-sn-glycerol-3-phosphate acyltransferase